MSSFEAAAYEIPEIWAPEWFAQADRDRVREMAALVPGEATSLLDAGCGNGLFLNGIQETSRGRLTPLVGVDRSAAALAHVATVRLRGRMDALPFRDRAFDAVSCLEVLEHLPVDVYAQALAELSRVARRYLVVSVPYRQDLDASLATCPACRARFNPDFHVRSFDEAAMAGLFEAMGFRAITIQRLGRSTEYIDQGLRARLRAWRHPEGLPGYAVCPVCGFHDPDKLRCELAERAAAMRDGRRAGGPRRVSPLRAWVNRVRPSVTRYRWICAVYAR